jgi:hypothetical protein
MQLAGRRMDTTPVLCVYFITTHNIELSNTQKEGTYLISVEIYESKVVT